MENMEKNGLPPIAARDEGTGGVDGVSLATLRAWCSYAYTVVVQGSISKVLHSVSHAQVCIGRATYKNAAPNTLGLKATIRRFLHIIELYCNSTSPLLSGKGSDGITNRELTAVAAGILAHGLSFLTFVDGGRRQVEVPLMA